MDAVWGRLLDVDLSKDRIGICRVPEEWLRLHLGGKGLAVRILMEEFPDGAEPLSPENPLIYMTGPLAGLSVGGSGRHVVVTRSPLTGLLGEAYAGGFFADPLKKTGYDGIIFRGKAEGPTYLTVQDGDAELHPADDLWGKTTSETEEVLQERHGGVRVSGIGPAGENLVRYAAIINDRNRANGRCGVGAVMGSKNLKAVAVSGHRKVPVADEARFAEVRKGYTRTLASHPGMVRFGKYGTADGVEYYNERGILPTRNFSLGTFHSPTALSGETMVETILTGRDTCTACPVRCKREVETEAGGREVKAKHGGPEYETLAAFGSNQMNDSLDYVALANQLCNEYGLDTISTGNVLGYAMEATERGLLEDGIEWGDSERAVQLVEDIACRRGLGDRLAEGVKRFSEEIGGEEFAVHIKGSEVPMHEPRGKKGLGLSYAVSPRGANHLEGLHDTMVEKGNASPELGAVEGLSRFAVEGKPRLVKSFEDCRSFTNSLILCVFDVIETGKAYNLPEIREMTSAATGLEIDAEEMFRIGERAVTLARMFSIRTGMTAEMDDLPPRFKREALKFGEREEAVTEEELRTMIAEYYELRGWDDAGIPRSETLSSLDIGDTQSL
jgi:aldehyde:ferredoxin oxidoreductase